MTSAKQVQATLTLSPTLQTLSIMRGPSGKKLRKPITVSIPMPRTLDEKSLQQYVINAFAVKMPSLIDFTFRNMSVLEVAKHLKRHATGSEATLYQYIYGIYRYCKWIRQEPDQLLSTCKDAEGIPDYKEISRHARSIDDFIGELQAEGLAPGTISNHVKEVKTLYRVNRIPLELTYRLSKKVKYKDRSPT